MNGDTRDSQGSVNNRSVWLDPDTFYVCQRCTACCKWPGDVRVDDHEIQRISRFLGLSEERFIETCTRLRQDRQGLSLREKENGECVMLEGGLCRIHPVKPDQCEGFPNKWNFEGWREVCCAIPIPMPEAIEKGLAQAE